MWWGCSGAQPAWSPERHKLPGWTVPWSSRSQQSLWNNAENFYKAVKTTVGKTRCSGSSEAQAAGCSGLSLVLQHPHSSPCSLFYMRPHAGKGDFLRAVKNHMKSANGITIFHKKEGYFPYWKTPMKTGALQSRGEAQWPGRLTDGPNNDTDQDVCLRTTFDFWNIPEKRVSQVYVHCIPLTPGFLWLCKLQGERTFLFPAVALPWKMYTKHSLPCDVSCTAVSTSEVRRLLSDSLSATSMICS